MWPQAGSRWRRVGERTESELGFLFWGWQRQSFAGGGAHKIEQSRQAGEGGRKRWESQTPGLGWGDHTGRDDEGAAGTRVGGSC